MIDHHPGRARQLPDIINAAIAGKLPPGIALRQLIDLSADWTRQRTVLGLV